MRVCVMVARVSHDALTLSPSCPRVLCLGERRSIPALLQQPSQVCVGLCFVNLKPVSVLYCAHAFDVTVPTAAGLALQLDVDHVIVVANQVRRCVGDAVCAVVWVCSC